MQIIFIRHPQPDIASGICYGSTDLPLHAEVLKNLPSLATELGAQLLQYAQAPRALFTSPLQRCSKFAKSLSDFLKDENNLELLVQDDSRLQELYFGEWEGKSWDTIGAERLDAWIASNYAALHGGESATEFDARVVNFINTTIKHYPEKSVLWIVCHAGVIRSVLRQLLGFSFLKSLAWPIDYSRTLSIRCDDPAPNSQHYTLLWSNL